MKVCEGLLRGDVVSLCAHRSQDLDVYTRWFQDTALLGLVFTGPSRPVTREEQQRLVDDMAADTHAFAVRTLDGDRLVGTCALRPVDARNRSTSFGIVMGEPGDWGHGYGTDAARVALRYAFDELNVHRVQLTVFDFNERAIRAFTKAGFRQEVRRREALWRDGRWWDDVIMGVLAPEWREANPGNEERP